MWLIYNRNTRVQDKDPTLKFTVKPDDCNDFKIDLRGRSFPLLELIGVSRDNLVNLRDEIDKVLCVEEKPDGG